MSQNDKFEFILHFKPKISTPTLTKIQHSEENELPQNERLNLNSEYKNDEPATPLIHISFGNFFLSFPSIMMAFSHLLLEI